MVHFSAVLVHYLSTVGECGIKWFSLMPYRLDVSNRVIKSDVCMHFVRSKTLVYRLSGGVFSKEMTYGCKNEGGINTN
jgi:hypothetical protein